MRRGPSRKGGASLCLGFSLRGALSAAHRNPPALRAESAGFTSPSSSRTFAIARYAEGRARGVAGLWPRRPMGCRARSGCAATAPCLRRGIGGRPPASGPWPPGEHELVYRIRPARRHEPQVRQQDILGGGPPRVLGRARRGGAMERLRERGRRHGPGLGNPPRSDPQRGLNVARAGAPRLMPQEQTDSFKDASDLKGNPEARQSAIDVGNNGPGTNAVIAAHSR